MRESRLLQYIYEHAAAADDVVIPPGDDMGGVRIGGQTVLVTVDQLIDGIHGRVETAGLSGFGRKAMTRNLSDVAAMAARPLGAVVAVCLPRSWRESQATGLFDAMQATGERYACPLFGGDISIGDSPLAITVTILAEPAGVEPVLRSQARAGDAVFVTGRLGGAWAESRADAPHLTFEPRLDLARQLAETCGGGLRSMIDLSDGLAADLPRICRASNVTATVHAKALPIRDVARRAAARDSRSALEHALCDGEDYELCFTVEAEAAERLPDELLGVTLTRIGRIEPGPATRVREPVCWLDEAGEPMMIQRSGWDHHS